MAGEIRTVPLSDLYEFSSGLSKPRSEFGFGHAFLTFKDVLDNFFVPDVLSSLVNSTEEEQCRYSIKRGDVFLTRTSETQPDLGMSSVALKDYPKATFNGFSKRLRPKITSSIIPEYVAYFFRCPKFRQAVTSMSSLSTRASLNNEMLSRLFIDLPPIKTQKIIGNILKSLDDKIELNRRTNRVLEEMARTIFKAWFVDFEPVKAKAAGATSFSGMPQRVFDQLPKALVDSELGKIPKGWDVVSLSDVCAVGRGGSPRPINNYMNGTIPWIKIADATASNGPFIFETKERLKESGVSKSVKVKPGDLILSNSATCGIPMFVELHGCIHDGWLHFKDLKRVSKLFLFHTLENLTEHLVHIADGSVQKNLNTALVGLQRFVVPPPSIAELFDDASGSWFRLMRNSGVESRILVAIRNTLLPKLISGDIAIPAAKGGSND